MLMPHPATLRRLVDEYEALIVPEGESGAVVKPDQRAQDLAYTLCVSTGTRDVRRALERARRHLAAVRQPVAPTRPMAPVEPVAPMASRPPGAGGPEARDGGEAVTR
ncbi:hypothetical protein GCM10010306_057990 [Streptomyces umbrinus]|jgi:hypothetical protein|uniref:DUF5133 domain-containing protein n=1 Tax=Streptomyces umbrinus TaxID=67370 RepID=UPI001676D633|nr:DUF5133 domain-containing protein [Streptomyces umbrinus]GHB56720.1 hypothetical protein GCM10010306_057990 [Streptomyces umbrinus]